MWTTNRCKLYLADGMLFLGGNGVDAEDFEVVSAFCVEVFVAAEVEGWVRGEEGGYGGREGCAVALVRQVLVCEGHWKDDVDQGILLA